MLGRPLSSWREGNTKQSSSRSTEDTDGAEDVSPSLPGRQPCWYQRTPARCPRAPSAVGTRPSRCQAKASPRSGFAATLLLPLFIRAAWLLLACCLLFFTAEQISFKSNSCCWSAGTRCLKQPLPRVVSVTPSRSRARSLQRARASWQHCSDSRSGHSACPSQPSCVCSIILRAGWFLEEFRASSQRSWNANASQAAAPAIRLNRADKLHL